MNRIPAILLVLAALSLSFASASGAQGDDSPPLSGGRVAGQVALGVVGTPVGFVAGGLATRWVARKLGADDRRASDIAYAGAWTGAALVTAIGPTYVGSRGDATGSYGAAVAGAVAGGAVSYLVVRLNRTSDDEDAPPCRIRCALSTAAVFLMPSVGATVGFNLSRRYE